LYYVDNDGTRTPGQVFSVGSGSLYAYGVLDSGYKHDLTDEEAYELGRRAIYHATYRDASSGGIIRGNNLFLQCFLYVKQLLNSLFLVYHIKSTGWVKISEQDCTELHYQYEEAERTSK
jgi:20S proteasome subunit beta 5